VGALGGVFARPPRLCFGSPPVHAIPHSLMGTAMDSNGFLDRQEVPGVDERVRALPSEYRVCQVPYTGVGPSGSGVFHVPPCATSRVRNR
jgi:hypothetical protein